MKRISLLFAMVLILAVAAPVMAGPFSDVPATHWAYDALQKVSSTGIITGYPDGTFKGGKTVTRYEIAIVVSRVLDAVAAERALLAEKVDALEDGLTAGQAEDVIAIFKSLISKYNVSQGATPVQADSLSAAQAEEVAGIVEALTMEFMFELEALGADIDAINADVAALDARVTELEKGPAVKFTGDYSVDYIKTVVDGAGYVNPFDLSEDELDADDDTFEQAIDFAMNINKAPFAVDVNLSASSDLFGSWTAGDDDDFTPVLPERSGYDDDKSFTIDGFNATVTTDEVTVTIDNGQELVLSDFILGDADATYDGVIAKAGNSTYAVVRYTEDVTTELEVAGFGDHSIPATYTHDGVDYVVIDMATEAPVTDDAVVSKLVVDVLAAKQELGVLDTTAFFGVGTVANGQYLPVDVMDTDSDIEIGSMFMEDTLMVGGLESGYDVLGIDLDTKVAVSRTRDGENDYTYGKYFSVAGKRNIAALELAAGYRKIDEFVDFIGDIDAEDGYDVSASLPMGPLTVKGDYTVITDDENVANAGAELVDWNVLGLTVNADYNMEMRNRDENTKADRETRNVEVATSLFGFDVTTGYKYDQYTDYDADMVYGEEVTEDVVLDINDDLSIYQYDNYGDKLTEDVWEAADTANNVYANLAWNTFIPGLNVTADYTYELDKDVETKLSEQVYGANFEMGILTAGLEHDRSDADDITTVVNAGLEYSVFTANVEKEMEGDLTVTASVDPNEFNVLGLGVDTVASVEMINNTDALNYDLGVDFNKSIDALTMTAGYNHANHKIDNQDTNEYFGIMNKYTAGMSYALTDDISADLNYTNVNFKGTGYDEDKVVVDQLNAFQADYVVEQITGGFSFSF